MQVECRSRGIALLNLELRARWLWVVKAMSRLLFPGERAMLPIAQEAVWAPEPVWEWRRGNHLPQRGSNPEPCSPQRVSIPTTLYRSAIKSICVGKYVLIQIYSIIKNVLLFTCRLKFCVTFIHYTFTMHYILIKDTFK
jgi:hypothetical protein